MKDVPQDECLIGPRVQDDDFLVERFYGNVVLLETWYWLGVLAGGSDGPCNGELGFNASQ